MGNLLAFGAKKLTMGALGLVAALVWMTLTGGGGGAEELDRFPASVTGGGAGLLSIELSTNQPAELHAAFEQWDEEDEGEAVGVTESLEAGTHLRRVDVGRETYVYVEVGIPEATVGARLSWTVSLDGVELWSEDDVLEEPLRDGYAFFLQLEADSMEELRSWASTQ